MKARGWLVFLLLVPLLAFVMAGAAFVLVAPQPDVDAPAPALTKTSWRAP